MTTGEILFYCIPLALIAIVIWVWLAFKLTFVLYADKHLGKGDDSVPFIASGLTILFLWLEVAIPYGLYLLYNYLF